MFHFLGFIVNQTSDYRFYFFVAGLPPLISAIIIFLLRFMKRAEDAKYDFAEQLFSKIDSNSESSRPKCRRNENFALVFESSLFRSTDAAACVLLLYQGWRQGRARGSYSPRRNMLVPLSESERLFSEIFCSKSTPKTVF